MVQRGLHDAGLNAQHLELEVTEAVAMHKIDKTISTLNVLNEMGIYISIDDYGMGYSSLSYLKQFPVHALKIDQSFIHNIENNRSDQAIVKSTIMLAHDLGLSVIAEGKTPLALNWITNY